MIGRVVKFWSLTRREKKFVCEASILLLLSNTCVKVIAFRHIDRFLRSSWNDNIQRVIDHEQEIRAVQRSISRAANVLPWKSLCLSRSIVEFIMLRRRGLPAILFAGVKFSGKSALVAHAWVHTGLVANNMNSENSEFTAVISIGKAS
jgi:hypothetical protein